MIAILKNRIKDIRGEYKLTQDDLAKMVGVTRQTIISLEKGNYIPSLLLAMNISEVFERKIEDIFFKEEEIIYE